MNDLGGARVLVTGGAGFVGSTIADRLMSENIKEVILLDNLVRGSEDNIKDVLGSGRSVFVKGDIRDRGLLDEIFEGIDYCFHMAALRITQCAEQPREAIEVMVDGTFNVAESCLKHKVKKIIVASSASIYGHAGIFPTKEDHHPYNNITLYGAAKAADELIFRALYHMYGLKYIAMRYFNIYGPRMDIYGKYTEVLIKWYNLIKDGKRPLIYGDGKQAMDFIYIDDVARANIMGLKSGADDESFNIASGVETSLEELCRALLETMDSKLEPQYVSISNSRRKVEVMRRLADTRKASTLVGFRAEVRLKDGLKKLLTWLDKKSSEARVV